MIPFTVNEIRRLWATLSTRQHDHQHTTAWSRWRRRRQMQARRSHYKRRLNSRHAPALVEPIPLTGTRLP